MATTTAAISIASSDLTGDALALSATTTLYKAGTVIGLDQTTGLASKYYAAVQSNVEIIPAGSYDDNGAHWVYIKNSGSSTEDYFTIELSLSGYPVLGRLYGGDWTWLPYEGETGIGISSSATKMTLEYMVVYQSV
tara:strand:- start:1128 stop:1535 length:408 start_codon:yes stop_codon:yes gene_type:complete